MSSSAQITTLAEFVEVVEGTVCNLWQHAVYDYIVSHIDDVTVWRNNRGLTGCFDLSNSILSIVPKQTACKEDKASFMLNVCELGSIGWCAWCHNNNFPWDEKNCRAAAKGGHLSCLKFAHANNCVWDKMTTYEAAKEGHLDILKYAHANGCEWHRITCSLAAGAGFLECLEYAHSNGAGWSEHCTNFAAANGQLDCLIYARSNGCKWESCLFSEAAAGGHINCMKWALDNGLRKGTHLVVYPAMYDSYVYHSIL